MRALLIVAGMALFFASSAPGQPVVLITAYAEVLKASNTPLEGIDFVISKPFFLEHLREAIARTTNLSGDQ